MVCVVRFVTTLGLCDIHPWHHFTKILIYIFKPSIADWYYFTTMEMTMCKFEWPHDIIDSISYNIKCE